MPYDPTPSAGHRDNPARSLGRRFAALGPRQQEIAKIVYSRLIVTPREVQEQLSEPRSLRVVRTLLERMVSKGLVKRRPSGRHREVIYVAAVATARVREVAVEKLIQEQFGGSLSEAVTTTEKLARKQSLLAGEVPGSAAAVRRLAGGWLRSCAPGLTSIRSEASPFF